MFLQHVSAPAFITSFSPATHAVEEDCPTLSGQAGGY